MRRSNFSIFLIMILLLGAGNLRANPEEVFEMANEAFEQKKYAESVSLYEKLLRDNYRSSSLLYNLGMACLEQRQLGKAVLYLERAAILRPDDKDIHHNLKLIRTSYLEDQLDIIPESFLERWWRNSYQSLSSGTWTILSIIFIWLAMAGLSIWRIGKTRKFRKWGFFAGIALLVFSVLFANLALSRYNFEYNNGRGVIMNKEANLMIAPDNSSEIVLELHHGTTCKILSELNSWFKVRLSDGRVGWMEKKDLSLI